MNWKNLFIFLSGAAIGAGGTYLYMKKIQTDIIEGMSKELIENAESKPEKSPDENSEKTSEPTPHEVAQQNDILKSVIKKEGYTHYSEMYDQEKKDDPNAPKMPVYNLKESVDGYGDILGYRVEEEEDESEEEGVELYDLPARGSDEPYTITPDEFGDREGYQQISLTYYADGILADEDDRIIEDIEGEVGSDNLEKIGEYEDDAVFIRNDLYRCDYEVLLDHRNYDDVVISR